MLSEVLITIYERDLKLLRAEIAAYDDAADMWVVEGAIANSAGNLCQHIVGNLSHFIGAVLGGSGYLRDREAEFASKGADQETLLNDIDDVSKTVAATLRELSDNDLAKLYPIEVFGKPMTTEYFLVHLATHLNYHLGQINYHRRLLAEK